MKKKLAMVLVAAVAVCGTLSGCGGTKDSKNMVYAVEAGSAGEEVANEKGFQTNAVASQADALMDHH